MTGSLNSPDDDNAVEDLDGDGPELLAVAQQSTFVHQEIVKLALLIGAAVVAFFVTRAIAANNRDMNLRDAAEWYERGQRQLDAGDTGSAVDSFRRATVKDRDERRYVIALAGALAGTQQNEAARRALLALRESAPEDPDINLQLARLDAGQQDVSEAVRYYHNALYAPWPADQADARRRARIELIRLLLTHRMSNRAVSELVALSADLPDDAAAHLEAGGLFASAGDHAHALEQFQSALRRSPDDGAALAGAGQAAFALADYPLAQRYLRNAPQDLDGVRETQALADLVLTHDPLGARLGSSARRQRLLDGVSYVGQRLNACGPQQTRGQPSAPQLALRDETQAFMTQLTRPAVLDSDLIETGLDLISRVEQELTRSCPAPDPLDRAWILIGDRHGGRQP